MKHYASDRVNDKVTVVLGFTELLLDESFGSLYPKQEEVLRQVLRAANELKQILLENPPRFVQD